MNLSPYIFFTGNCREAMEFYKSIFGGELTLTSHSEGTGIMHADLQGEDIHFFACDGTRTTPYETSFITLSLNGSDTEKLTTTFNKLSEGGTITSALKTESWGDIFGMVTDKFGVDWMVNIHA